MHSKSGGHALRGTLVIKNGGYVSLKGALCIQISKNVGGGKSPLCFPVPKSVFADQTRAEFRGRIRQHLQQHLMEHHGNRKEMVDDAVR